MKMFYLPVIVSDNKYVRMIDGKLFTKLERIYR